MLGESFQRTRRGKPQATGGNAAAAHVCYYCAAPEIIGKDPNEPPSRGHHRYFECTKRKRDNRREFHCLSRAPDALIDELFTEKRDAVRMQNDIIALHQVSVAAAQLSRRQSYWLGGACRMVAIRLRRHQLGDAPGAMPPPPPAVELSPAALGSRSYLGQLLLGEARLAAHWRSLLVQQIARACQDGSGHLGEFRSLALLQIPAQTAAAPAGGVLTPWRVREVAPRAAQPSPQPQP